MNLSFKITTVTATILFIIGLIKEGVEHWRSDGGQLYRDNTQGPVGSVKASLIRALARSYQLPARKYTFQQSHWTVLGFSPLLTQLRCHYRNVRGKSCMKDV